VPLVDRKGLLKSVIAGTATEYGVHFEIDGAELSRRACEAGLEGIVSKAASSPYSGGRGDFWVKTTCAHRETLAIAGLRPGRQQMGWRLCRSAQGRRVHLRR
jgi:bifunctional non-homologous end joining protein LigD